MIHHSGDIDMSTFDLFDSIGKETKITASLLPIGGMLPVWYYRKRQQHLDKGVHIDPDTALDIASRLRCQTFIPIHWGTLHLPYLTRFSPAKRLLQIAKQKEQDGLVKVLNHAEIWDID